MQLCDPIILFFVDPMINFQLILIEKQTFI